MISGPNTDTQGGDIVIIVVPPDVKFGVNFTPDADGCAAVVESFDRIQNGRFGPVQKHGGVHYGDVLFEFNDIPLLNTKHADVLKMINDKNVLKRELKFINSKDYYRRKRGNSMRINPIDGKNSFMSTVKRTRISELKTRKFIEYEVTCQMRVVGNKVQSEVVYQWSVWKRYSEFLELHNSLKLSLGWQMNGIEFPPSYWMVFNKLAPEFTEKRREELKDYWNKIASIDKVTEFHKHHCSDELKRFLSVDQNTSMKVAAVADMVDEDVKNNNTESKKPENDEKPAKQVKKQINRSSSQRRSLLSVQNSPPNNVENSKPQSPTTSSIPSSSPPPPPPQPQQQPQKDPRLEKFEKMQKTGLPEGAIRQKMMMEGFSDEEIAAFFGNSYLNDSAQLPPPPPPQPQLSKPDQTVPPPKVSKPAEAPPQEGKLPPKSTGPRANLLSSINALRKD